MLFILAYSLCRPDTSVFDLPTSPPLIGGHEDLRAINCQPVFGLHCASHLSTISTAVNGLHFGVFGLPGGGLCIRSADRALGGSARIRRKPAELTSCCRLDAPLNTHFSPITTIWCALYFGVFTLAARYVCIGSTDQPSTNRRTRGPARHQL